MYARDTIAAISTGVGEGAIGIVRMSGPEAFPIIARIFVRPKGKAADLGNFKIHYGYIVDPETGDRVDEVLVSCMRGPRTYTREDIVEINCHGGFLAQRKVLELLVREGARLAEPGEFTRRAFLNGRIDLIEAEAVLHLVKAGSEEALKIAARQCSGAVSVEVNEVREKIVDILSELEANLDFVEEDLEEIDTKRSLSVLRGAREGLAALLKGEHVGSIFQRGVVVAIVGKANVGKSSLLNSLLKEEKALVTEVPGTTRDAIEGQINLEGIPFRLIDTAGIRKTGDRVEILGVERSKNKVQEAQIALIVLDGSQDLDEQDLEIITLTKGKARLFAINKADLGVKIALDDPALYGEIVVVLSAKTREGLKELEKEMIALVVGEEGLSSGDAVLLNLRQRSHLQNANQVIGEAISALEKKEGEEIAALLLREALGHLDSITGKNFQKDLVDSIFSRFCIGK